MANDVSREEKVSQISEGLEDLIRYNPSLRHDIEQWQKARLLSGKGEAWRDQSLQDRFTALTNKLFQSLSTMRVDKGAVEPPGVRATPHIATGGEGKVPSPKYTPEEYDPELEGLKQKLGLGEVPPPPPFGPSGPGVGGTPERFPPPAIPPDVLPAGGPPPSGPSGPSGPGMGGPPERFPPPSVPPPIIVYPRVSPGGGGAGNIPPPPPGGPPESPEGGGSFWDWLRGILGGTAAAGRTRRRRPAGEGMGTPEKAAKVADTLGALASGDILGFARLVGEATEEFKKSVGRIGGELKGAATGERFGEVGGHMFGAAGETAHLMGLSPMEHMAKFGKAIMESIDKLRDWSEALHRSNMQFAEFSGAMAGVQARQEIREMQLSQERGDRRAAAAEFLAERQTRLETAVAPWEDLWAKVKALVMGSVSNWLSDLVGIARPAADNLNRMVDEMIREGEGTGMEAAFRQIAEFDQRFNVQGRPTRLGERPPRPPGGPTLR